jgi:hypothetical protein
MFLTMNNIFKNNPLKKNKPINIEVAGLLEHFLQIVNLLHVENGSVHCNRKIGMCLQIECGTSNAGQCLESKPVKANGTGIDWFG